jgi:RNA polymerase sigma-70 factor, ECF subfamily
MAIHGASPADPVLRAVLDRFALAVEAADPTALAALLREDVALELPPCPTWFAGRAAVLDRVAAHLSAPAGRIRLVPAAANGQPAFAAYRRDADGLYRAHAMIVLTASGALIARIVVFLEPALFRLFAFPLVAAMTDRSAKKVSPGGV